jgi:hypothetical protein
MGKKGLLLGAWIVIAVATMLATFFFIQTFLSKPPAQTEVEPEPEPVPLSAPELSAWKAAGLPMTKDEIILPPIAPEDDAAPEWRRAIELYLEHAMPMRDRSVFFDENNWDNGAVDKVLKENADILALLRTASKKPRMSFDYPWDEGHYQSIPDYIPSTQIPHLLVYSAVGKARKGDWKGALAELETGDRLVDLLQQHPLRPGRSSAMEMERVICEGVGMCAAVMDDNAEALAAFRAFLPKISRSVDRLQAFRAQAYVDVATYRAFGDAELKAYEKKLEEELPAGLGPQGKRLEGDMVRGTYVRDVTAAIMAYWARFYPRLLAKEPFEKVSADMNDARIVADTSQDPVQQAASRVFGSFEGGAVEELSEERRAQLEAFIAVLQHRQKTGSLPATLKEAGLESKVIYTVKDGKGNIGSAGLMAVPVPWNVFPHTRRKP